MVHGTAGTGKSTLAQTIADYFGLLHLLGAYTFFLRNKSNPDIVIRTVAYRLACFSRVIAEHMRDAVKDVDITSLSLMAQFEILFVGVLGRAEDQFDRPVIIVFDAVDECGPGQERRNLMPVLARLTELPKKFRFLITTRLEQDIAHTFLSLPAVMKLEMNPTFPDSQQDVRTYLDVAMRRFFSPSTLR